jgi:uncharacterized membrane protein YhaH (DUF805 family)
MIEHFKTAVFHKYADFRTRSSRSEYWYFLLVYIILSIILLIPIFGSLGSLAAAEVGEEPSIGMVAMICMGIWFLLVLILIIPSIAVSVRRLHDSGKSGLWYLIAFVPFGSIVLLVLMCLDSEPGTNKWGPNPHELASGDEISGHLIERDIV